MAARKAARSIHSPAAEKPTTAAATHLSRGPVDAPGKRHRKPPPQERLDARLGDVTGKKMGQKGVKAGWRSGRR